MANDEDPAQTRVEACADELKAQLPQGKPAFISVHFLCGIPELPGYIRRSSGRALNCKLAEFADHERDEHEQNRLHRNAMLEHVRAFDRRHTLFNLAARISKKKESDIFLDIEFASKGSDKQFQIESKVEKGACVFTITLSEVVAALLAPEDISLNYLSAAYARATDPFKNAEPDRDDHFLRRFTRARAEAFGRLLASTPAGELLGPLADSLGGDSDEEKFWNLLNPIQSTAVYAHGVDSGQRHYEIGCLRRRSSSENGMAQLSDESQPFVLVFASFCDRQSVESAVKKNFGDDTLDTRIANYLQYQKNGQPGTLRDELRKQGSYSDAHLDYVAKEIERQIEPIVCLPSQKRRLAALTWWMCLLAQKLHGRIHEGEPLDFWFVAGERAEFADDARFRLDKVLKDRNSLRPPLEDDLKINEGRLNAAVRYLEKEHFPWFHRGRHALLFDISDEELRPVGLVEVANSSWHQVLDESFKPADDQYLRLPGCAVVFVDGETQDAGLIRVNPQARGLQRIRRIMRLHKAHWHVIGSDQRAGVLRGLIQEAMENEIELANEVTEICLRVADDPNTGGTLVFTDSSHAKEFLKLGESWVFGDSIQIPLIAHDGATLLYSRGEGAVKNWECCYRQLLTPSEMNPELQNVLQRWSLDYSTSSPLNGVGTRRWSAALTALRKGVRLVVVISQDGGITCWRAVWNDTKPKTLHSVSLTLGGAVERRQCEFPENS